MGETGAGTTNGADHACSATGPSAEQGDPPPLAEPLPPDIEKHDHPHTLSAQAVAERFQTHLDHGLISEEAAARLSRDGPNSLQVGKGVSFWQILLAQVANALTAILIAVMVISFAINDYIEGGVVAAVIALNIIVGCVLFRVGR